VAGVHVADAMWPQTSASAARPGCPAATGALRRTTLGPVAGRLHTQSGFQIGRNRWYVLPAGASRGVLKVRRGVIQEVGIANRSLTAGGGARRLLAGLD